MHLMMINAYEFGQFLRILLWICVPIAMGVLLITTWLQYRRRQKFSDGLFLSVEGVSSGKEEAMASAHPGAGIGDPGRDAPAAIDNLSNDAQGMDEPGRDAEGRDASDRDIEGRDTPGRDALGINGLSKDDRVEEPAPRVAETLGEDDFKENLYKGILWMKDKYEQYRDMADQRYERLKDQLTKVERRYEDLLASLGGSHSVAGAKAAQPTARLATASLEPMAQVEPPGVEPMTMAESVGDGITGRAGIHDHGGAGRYGTDNRGRAGANQRRGRRGRRSPESRSQSPGYGTPNQGPRPRKRPRPNGKKGPVRRNWKNNWPGPDNDWKKSLAVSATSWRKK